MDAYEKFTRLREVMGDAQLLEELYGWFPTREIEEAVDDIANTWDIELGDGD